MRLWRRMFRYFERRRAARIARALRAYFEPGDAVLDLGCGTLAVAQQIERHVPVRVIGLETIDYHRHAVPLVLYDGVHIPFRDQSFDVVLLAFVLHHCDDGGLALLRAALRLARKRIFVLEDRYDHAAERLWTRCLDRLLNGLEHAGVPTPCRFRSSAEWQRVFCELGMETTAMRPLHTTPLVENRQLLFVLHPAASGTAALSLQAEGAETFPPAPLRSDGR